MAVKANDKSGGLSRRDLLKAAALGGLAAGLGSSFVGSDLVLGDTDDSVAAQPKTSQDRG